MKAHRSLISLLAVDGVYVRGKHKLEFRRVSPPTKANLDALLKTITAPTLIISARDDAYGTFASAQYTASRIPGARFVGFEQGGHTWVGHNDAVIAEILRLLVIEQPRGCAQ